MPSDPSKPLLRLEPHSVRSRQPGKQKGFRGASPYPRDQQAEKFSPRFSRLAELLERDSSGLELKADPTALAPERLLVFEVRGPIATFADAVRQVPGLELIDEEELESDEDKHPVVYVLLKALLAHGARWSEDTASLIREIVGPQNGKQHVAQKDNVRRFLGYGVVDPDEVIACAADRAVFWAAGILERQKAVTVSVPIPEAMNARAQPHELAATVAWFTPIQPGRRSYRAVRLKLLKPAELGTLQVDSHRHQPDANQANRGTVLTRCWTGRKAPAVGPNMTVELTIQREPDQGVPIDEPIPFGLAVTVAMPGVLEIYEQARTRVAARLGAPA